MDDRDARIAPTPERLRYHASLFRQDRAAFMADWLDDCANEMERRDQQIDGLEATVSRLIETGMAFAVASWHLHIGPETTEEHEDAFYDTRQLFRHAMSNAEAARAGQGQRKGAGDG